MNIGPPNYRSSGAPDWNVEINLYKKKNENFKRNWSGRTRIYEYSTPPPKKKNKRATYAPAIE